MILLDAGDVLVVAAELLQVDVEDLDVDLLLLEDAVSRAHSPGPRDPAEAAARLFAELAGTHLFGPSRSAVAWLAACQLLSANGLTLPGGPPTPRLRGLLAETAAGAPSVALSAWIRSHCSATGRREGKEHAMFERFTDNARHVLASAQAEARLLDHNFIGTEHILLGLIAQQDTMAAQLLARAEITLDAARDTVRVSVPASPQTATRSAPPFTPRAKRVMELSLREAMALKSRTIDTQHILLGLIAEGDGLGVRVIRQLGVDPDALRQAAISALGGSPLEVSSTTLKTIDLSQLRQRMVGDLDVLTGRIRKLEDECQRLRALLERHGVSPDEGERTA